MYPREEEHCAFTSDRLLKVTRKLNWSFDARSQRLGEIIAPLVPKVAPYRSQCRAGAGVCSSVLIDKSLTLDQR